jgi:hypothetical protein
MSNGQKDTVYIDVDDEITAIIDKLRSSPHKIVALVLPKRAAVFQSVVNMKLLKRTADEAKKHVVLITAEAGLMPLAAAVGVHVAKTLQSRPEIPEPPAEDEHHPETHPSDELAAEAKDEDEEIEVDNNQTEKPTVAGGVGKAKAGKAAKAKKNRKLKVPNFDTFRKKLLLGGGAFVLLIVLWIVAFKVLPKATVTLKTDTSNLDMSLAFTADTEAHALDQENTVLPALSKESRKTDTEKVAATGQKDLGTKATGTVTLKNCSQSDNDVTIPAGTTVNMSNLNFNTQEVVTLPASSFNSSDVCLTSPKTVPVASSTPGEQYNISGGRSSTVAGFSGVNGVDSSAMSGGTSRIVKIVSQGDIDSAKKKITDRSNSDASKDLQEEFEKENYHALTDTLGAGEPTVTSTAKVGEEASEVTVTSTVVSAMLGVKKDDLKQFVEASAKKQIDESKQQIIDNGISKATLRVQQKQPDGKNKISYAGIVVAGPKLDDEAIKKEIAGKRRGEAQDLIRKRPGIKDVEIAYSPFWVQKTPKSIGKITIVFEQK